MSRIARVFDRLAAENRAAFIPFVMAGDPDLATSTAILEGLPGAGADIIELGVAFTDPMADGPAIQRAGLRALAAGQTLRRTLDMVRAFRARDDATPIVLMGYTNPIHAYGPEALAADAAAAGVDGLIVVDLPPEEDAMLRGPAAAAGLDLVRLATPTTDAARLATVADGASGFIYYVSVAGVTGAMAGDAATIRAAVAQARAASGLPVAVGFGVRDAAKAAEVGAVADAAVVGSAIVERIEAALADADGAPDMPLMRAVNDVLALARHLSAAVRGARGENR